MKTFDDMRCSKIENAVCGVSPSFSPRYVHSKYADPEIDPPSYDESEVVTLRPAIKRKLSLATICSGSEDIKTLANSELTIVDDARRLNTAQAPVMMEIHLTKVSTQSDEKVESQKILNEYTCGDEVRGFVVVHNDSFKPVTFETISLTLEGYVVAVNSQTRSRSCRNILKMADTGTDYSEAQSFGVKTNVDCLPEDKVLQPHIKYKRYFEFKLPDRLLDSTCPNGEISHSGLPPSLGLDKHHKCFKYRDLMINSFLGYARANERGSPIWAADFAQDLSISYAVKAVLVGKDAKWQEFYIMQEAEHFLRIIPSYIAPITRVKGDDVEPLGKVSETFCKTPEDGKKAGEVDVEVCRVDEKENHPIGDVAFVSQQLPYKIGTHPTLRDKLFCSPARHKKLYEISGLIVLSSAIPQRALPYRSPGLIAKDNVLACKSEHDRENRLEIQDLVGDGQGMPLKELQLEVICIPSGNSITKRLPHIKAVHAELICITGKSKNHISEDFCSATSSDKTKNSTMAYLYDSHVPTVGSHEEILNRHQGKEQSRGSEELISIQSRSAGEGVEDLEVKIDHLSDVFVNHSNIRKGLHKSNTNAKDSWDSDGIQYKRQIFVSLEYSKNFRGTLVPNFMSCMCFRSYYIRAIISFDEGVGDATLDVPINIRNIFFE
ncbi:(ZYRO0C01100g) [Zygosaccharomyces parabailii]|nr:(ZYRO0C01100g) [Zygosaccharomyces parabailii]CDH12580.1 uncharacterized protein ZBAI_04366 [Zygosaccharomyces bailii ISA1307]